MFEIRHLDPQLYRQQTRKSTLVVLVIFSVLAMSLSALAVALLGSPEGSNFRWNLAGVLLGLVATIMLVRSLFWRQNWMQPAVYGWQLKRSLMSVTNNSASPAYHPEPHRRPRASQTPSGSVAFQPMRIRRRQGPRGLVDLQIPRGLIGPMRIGQMGLADHH